MSQVLAIIYIGHVNRLHFVPPQHIEILCSRNSEKYLIVFYTYIE